MSQPCWFFTLIFFFLPLLLIFERVLSKEAIERFWSGLGWVGSLLSQKVWVIQVQIILASCYFGFDFLGYLGQVILPFWAQFV